jgi:hypothetical protein
MLHDLYQINPLKKNDRLLYLETQFVPRSKHFTSVYDVSGKGRCLFSDKYKTHNYSVARKSNSLMLNLFVHHVTSRL